MLNYVLFCWFVWLFFLFPFVNFFNIWLLSLILFLSKTFENCLDTNLFILLGYASRFLGFSLYISNTTNKLDGVLCFKDSNFTLSTIPPVFNTTCNVHGQYVIYYNERKYPGPYPPYSQYAYNEICELEVYGEIIQSDYITFVESNVRTLHIRIF